MNSHRNDNKGSNFNSENTTTTSSQSNYIKITNEQGIKVPDEKQQNENPTVNVKAKNSNVINGNELDFNFKEKRKSLKISLKTINLVTEDEPEEGENCDTENSLRGNLADESEPYWGVRFLLYNCIAIYRDISYRIPQKNFINYL